MTVEIVTSDGLIDALVMACSWVVLAAGGSERGRHLADQVRMRFFSTANVRHYNLRNWRRPRPAADCWGLGG